MIKTGLKIFAFFGIDLDHYPNDYLKSLFAKNYSILTLDNKAVEYATLSKVPFYTILDWIGNNRYLEIINNAWNCETTWFKHEVADFTMDGICWPELDHSAMHYFWLEFFLSLELVKKFKENSISKLLIANSDELNAVVHYHQGSICKLIWKHEFSDIIEYVDSYPKNNKIYRKDFIFQSKFHELLFSDVSIIKDKICFYASGVEISRSKDLIIDLITTYPKEVVIIPNNLHNDDILTILTYILNTWKIPVVSLPNILANEKCDSLQFLKAYQKMKNHSHVNILEKYLSILDFHFTFYCENRWPKLVQLFRYYDNLFRKNPPKFILGSTVNMTEWHIPILAAQNNGIKTGSIPHSISPSLFLKTIDSDLIHKYDYHFYINQFSRQVMSQYLANDDEKFRACINCTDINSHYVIKTKPEYPECAIKILVLFSPTSLYRYPETESRLIYLSKDPKKQIEAITELNELAREFNKNISIKFKVHPGFSEMEIFNGLGEEIKEKILPINSDLEVILHEVDLVIGVNYYGTALIHSLKSKKPFINYINDEFFSLLLSRDTYVIHQLKQAMIIVNHVTELKGIINQIIERPKLLENICSQRANIIDMLFTNSNYPTIGTQLLRIVK